MMRTAPAVTPVAIPATALFSRLPEPVGGALVDVELAVEEVLLLLLIAFMLDDSVVEDDMEVEVGIEEVDDVVGIVDVVCGLEVGLDVGLDVGSSLAVASNRDTSDEATLLGRAESRTSRASVGSAEAEGP